MLKFESRFSLEVELKLSVLHLDVSRHGTADPQKIIDFFLCILLKKQSLFSGCIC